VGNPATAKYKISAGWNYDPQMAANQENAGKIFGTLQNWAQSRSDVCLEIVDLDVPRSELSSNAGLVKSPGLSFNGSTIIDPSRFSTMLAAGPVSTGYIMSAIMDKTHG